MARYERSYVGERRTEGMRIALTPAERDELETAATGQGATLSDFAREVLFRRAAAIVAATRRNPEARALVQALGHSGEELSRTGNNLNQMALRAHTAGQVPEWEILRSLLEDYRQVMEMHKRAVARVLDL